MKGQKTKKLVRVIISMKMKFNVLTISKNEFHLVGQDRVDKAGFSGTGHLLDNPPGLNSFSAELVQEGPSAGLLDEVVGHTP